MRKSIKNSGTEVTVLALELRGEAEKIKQNCMLPCSSGKVKK
jgi:hypothetical protein